MNQSKKILWGLVLLCSVTARASELESVTDVGTGTFTEGLAYRGDHDSPGKEIDHATLGKGLNWTLGYAYTAITLGATLASPSPSPALSGAESDHTNSFTAGIGYEEKFEIESNLNFSNTKEENLKTFGLSIGVGYTFDLATRAVKDAPEKIEEKEDSFVPTLTIKAMGGLTHYQQDIGVAVRKGTRRKPQTAKASQSIQQKQFEFDVTVSPWVWLDVKLGFIKYNYNRDVANFLSKLDDPRAIRSGAADFGSTLEGFSSKESLLNFTFHLPAEIDLETDFSQSTSASNSSKINMFKFDVSKTWDAVWKTGLGFERNKSDTDVQNLGVVTLAYEF